MRPGVGLLSFFKMEIELREKMRTLSGWLLIAILATQFACGTLREIEVGRNRRLWRESGIKNYRMTVEVQKTGHATPNGKFVITVRGGRPESIKRADNLEPVPESIKFGNYKTLDDIFEYIEIEEKDGGAWHTREVEYDSKLGYPKKVNLDKSGVLDEELYFQVLQFEVLE